MIKAGNMIVRDPLVNGFSYDELEIGHTAFFSKTVSEHDVYSFAGATGDFNPGHVNTEVAVLPRIASRIVHGALTAGFVSTAIGTKMPGQGCLYVGQNSKFIRPVKFGDTVTVRLEIVSKDDKKRRVKIKTEVFNQHEELVLVGEADVLPKA